MWHPIKHYRTIHHHKMLVMKNCFRCGLYWQGLTHDLSKLSPVEFWAGAKYWQGTCSPNNAQRQKEEEAAAEAAEPQPLPEPEALAEAEPAVPEEPEEDIHEPEAPRTVEELWREYQKKEK